MFVSYFVSTDPISNMERLRAFLAAQMVKNLPAMQDALVETLSWKDPMEKGMATHSSIFALSIPWTEEPGGQ